MAQVKLLVEEMSLSELSQTLLAYNRSVNPDNTQIILDQGFELIKVLMKMQAPKEDMITKSQLLIMTAVLASGLMSLFNSLDKLADLEAEGKTLEQYIEERRIEKEKETQ